MKNMLHVSCVALALGLSACGGGASDPTPAVSIPAPTPAPDPTPAPEPAPTLDPILDPAPDPAILLQGDHLWSEHSCDTCHGDNADGLNSDGYMTGTSIIDSLGDIDLMEVIRDTMPFGSAGSCNEECSIILTTWLQYNFLDGNSGGSGETDPDADIPVAAMTPEEQLRVLYKVSNNLASRLPTQQEIQLLESSGEPALETIVNNIMTENAFYDRIKEIYNDHFHTEKFVLAGNGLSEFLETHGGPTANKDWALDYSTTTERAYIRPLMKRALAQGPQELIAYVIKNGRPFSEILTADYSAMNYFSARAYGLEDQVEFRRLDNPEFESVPYDPADFQEIHLNFPQAGVLTSPILWNTYRSSNTNRNRHRARLLFETFLDTDLFAIKGVRPNSDDFSDVNPTLNTPACIACHGVMDPVASVFWRWNNTTPLRRQPEHIGNWNFSTIKPAGFNGEEVPEGELASERWLGERMAKDPRFARSTVKTLFPRITGQALLTKPALSADDSEHERYQIQRDKIQSLATKFTNSGLDFKQLMRDIVLSDQFIGRSNIGGSGRMLPPELLMRKIESTTGRIWGDDRYGRSIHALHKDSKVYAVPYGGIDDRGILDRITQPNGILTAIQARMAAEVACRSVPYDFAKPQKQRLMFAFIEPETVPVDGSGIELTANVKLIKQNIRHLHWILYGEMLSTNDPDILDTYALYKDLFIEGARLKQAGGEDPSLPVDCQITKSPITGESLYGVQRDNIYNDANFYTRPWIALLTYMLSDYKFLYE